MFETMVRSTFFLMALALLVAMHVYLYFKLVRDLTASATLRKLGAACIIALAACLLLSRVFSNFVPAKWVQFPSLLGWSWFGLALYAGFCLIIVDALSWVQKRREKSDADIDISRRKFLAALSAPGAIGAASALSTYGAYRAFEAPAATEIALTLPKLPKALDGFRLVQLSDIHIGGVIREKFIETVVEKVQALKPDAVVITGDLMDGSVDELGKITARLMNIAPRYGTLFITGNHEYYSGVDRWCEALSAMKMTVLRNKSTVIPGLEGLRWVGVDDWSRRGRGGYDLDRALEELSEDEAAILLAHQPKGFEEAVQKGVGLQLSGHTHGGQMFPGTLMVNAVWRHPAGHFTEGSSHLYVHRGTGFWGPPMRVGSPPEIALFHLQSPL